jgi:hypothetical protein
VNKVMNLLVPLSLDYFLYQQSNSKSFLRYGMHRRISVKIHTRLPVIVQDIRYYSPETYVLIILFK